MVEMSQLRICLQSEKALENCPACSHPKAFMQVREDNY
jgi:hypothetical protein